MVDFVEDEIWWPEKYRPQKVKDVILPAKLKTVFQGYVNDKFIPNLLLAGGPGCGKTTVALCMCKELDLDYYFINGSLNGGIDTLRNDIQSYASSASMTGTRKVVILDEADNLSFATQQALRSFMEEFSKTTTFIFTCNTPSKIIPALRSRVTTVEFSNFVNDGPKLATQFYKRVSAILKNENVEFDNTVVASLIEENFPDWRKCLSQLQGYAKDGGSIDSGILTETVSNNIIHELFSMMAKNNFGEVRKWVAENSATNISDLFKGMYDFADDYLTQAGVAQMLIYMKEYEYSSAFVTNQEINMAAALAHIMADCDFKK